ncbi:hypothetical protein GGG16DRAFT_128772 [Schizophyllum commune]
MERLGETNLERLVKSFTSDDVQFRAPLEIPRKKSRPSETLRIQPENGREAVLLSALLDLEDENERCRRLLIEYQAVNILNQLYNAQLKEKLAERETKGKKNTPKGRLMGDGMPVVLTGDEFYQRVVEFNEDQKRRLAEKEARKVSREGYRQALEEWEKKRKAQKDAWEVRRKEWQAEVKRWEGARARWMKRKAEGKVSGRFAQKKPLLGTRPPAIPRPKLAESSADTGDNEGEAFDDVSSSDGTSEDEED